MTHESYVSPYVICSRGDSFRLSSIARLYNMSLRDGCCMLCWPFNMKMGHTLILSLYCAVCNIYYIFFFVSDHIRHDAFYALSGLKSGGKKVY